MTRTSTDREFDGSLHLSDGSHRTTAPYSVSPVGLATWEAKRARHIEAHVEDALKANANLVSDPGMRELFDRASKATQGRVYYLYITVPGSTEYYVAQGISGRLKRSEMITALEGVLSTEAL